MSNLRLGIRSKAYFLYVRMYIYICMYISVHMCVYVYACYNPGNYEYNAYILYKVLL